MGLPVKYAPGPIEALATALELVDDGSVNLDPVNLFAPGIYVRILKMYAGDCIISKIHKTEHFAVVLEGRCTVVKHDGTREEIVAPRIFKTQPGTQRALYIHEDTTWATFHPTDKTDVAEIEKDVIASDWDDPDLITHEEDT